MKSRVPYRRIAFYYWQQAKKYPKTFFAIFLFYGMGALVSDGVVPLIYRRMIDTIAEASSRPEVAGELFGLLGVLVIGFVFLNLSYRLGDFTMTWSQSKILRELANETFARLGRNAYQFFTDNFSGALVAKARRYVDAFENIHDRLVFDFWMRGIQMPIMIGVLWYLSPTLGFLFMLWVCIFIAAVLFLLRWQKRLNEAEAAEDSNVTGRLADVITNILNVKMFSSCGFEESSYRGATVRQERARFKAWTFNNYAMLVQGLLMGILEVGGMYLAIRMWIAGDISTGTVVLLQLYFGIVFSTLWQLGRSITRFTRSLSDAAEMVAIFDAPPALGDPATPVPVPAAPEGRILFDRVSFRYGEDSSDVFSDFSLSIASGEKVGFVGHSGAGKSTITKLILRFADVQSGAVSIDGIDVRAVAQDDLRSLIAYVPQDPVLFHRSLRENIAYGDPEATDAMVVEAAKQAHAHEFISALPHGYETLVGERGIKLSGGERQRVAIARAILKNAPILILDEATSSLDSVSEQYIQDAFATLMKGRTTIVIAHRLSTIQKMDRIVVLEGGRVVEEGTHASLLAKNGVYHDLWAHQSAGFIE